MILFGCLVCLLRFVFLSLLFTTVERQDRTCQYSKQMVYCKCKARCEARAAVIVTVMKLQQLLVTVSYCYFWPLLALCGGVESDVVR